MISRRGGNFLHNPHHGRKKRNYYRSSKKPWKTVRVGRAHQAPSKRKRTCSLQDRITAEMLQAFPEEAFEALTNIYKLRFQHHPSADDDGPVGFDLPDFAVEA